MNKTLQLVTKSESEPRTNAIGPNATQLVSLSYIIHVIPTNYSGLAPSKCQDLVELMDTIFPNTSGIVYCNQAYMPKT